MVETFELNSDQKKAVAHKKGPIIVVAGAGTGKTRVITERIKWLIQEKNVDADSVLALPLRKKLPTRCWKELAILCLWV